MNSIRRLGAFVFVIALTGVLFAGIAPTQAEKTPVGVKANCLLYQKTATVPVGQAWTVFRTTPMQANDYFYWDWKTVSGSPEILFTVEDASSSVQYNSGTKSLDTGVLIANSGGKWTMSWTNMNPSYSVDVEITAKFCDKFTLTASPTSGKIPLTVTFTVNGEESQRFGFSWSFGDGGTGTGATTTHQYTKIGTYPVKLNVTDAVGQTNNYLTASIEARDTDAGGGAAGTNLMLVGAIIAVIIIVVVVVVLYIFIIKKKKAVAPVGAPVAQMAVAPGAATPQPVQFYSQPPPPAAYPPPTAAPAPAAPAPAYSQPPPAAYPLPSQQAPPPAQPAPTALCPTCRSPLRIIPEYNKWYCDRCRRYP
jgi:PKD repeat protein